MLASSQLAEGIILSQYDVELMTAVSWANYILAVTWDLTMLMAVGTLVLVAQYLGQGDTERAEQAATIGIYANAAFGLAVGLVFAVLAPPLVYLLETPAELVGDVLIYIYVAVFAIALLGFVNAGNVVLRGYGHTIELMVINGLGLILSLGLLYATVFGRWGLPEMGVWGAAGTTLVVRGLSVGAMIVVLAWRLDFAWRVRYGWGTVRRVVGRIFKLSYPSVGADLAFNLYQLSILPAIGLLGAGATTARSYVFQLTFLLTIIGMVISRGNEVNEVLVGYDRGNEENRKARRRAFRSAIGVSLATMALTVPMYFFAEPLLGLFMSEPEQYAEVIAEVRTALLIFVFYQPLQTLRYVLWNSLKAVGDVLVPAVYSVAGMWGIALPLTYLFVQGFGLGVSGLFLALLVAEMFRASVMSVRWGRMRWTRYHVTERGEGESEDGADQAGDSDTALLPAAGNGAGSGST